ncbi:MAG: hypothetical protein ACK42Z_03250 [Candidatus Kapaibacteriota bacterium]
MLAEENIILNHRIRHLREQIEEQKKILLELVERWYYLRYELQPKIEFEYEKIFGDLENEIEQKVELCNKIERKIELLFVKINRGMKITRDVCEFVEKSVEKAIDQSFNTSKISHNSDSTNSFGKTETAVDDNHKIDFNSMYRKLVKLLHPDLSGETEHFKKFWVPIQDAYKEKNFSKIRVFYKILCENFTNLDDNDDVARKLEEELREIKLMIGIERRVLDRMILQEPFIYEKSLKNPVWIKEHRKKLLEKISFLERQIDFNRKLLDKIKETLED